MERKWWTLVLVSVATFMLLLDVTIVNVALPDIQRSLHASLSSLQWVVDAYSLMLASFLLTAGSLGDRLGRRRVFTIGFGIFTFASFLCGISDSPTLLNLCRGLQGIGGAGMFATSLALIGQEFQGKDRATAFGVWGATIGGAVAIGPLIGGVITENFGWEWIFFVNVPIGIVAMVLTERKVRNVFAEKPEPIDVPGLVTFSASLFLFIFALIRGNPEGWGSAVILACLIGAAVLMAIFITIETRTRYPMLDLTLFRNPGLQRGLGGRLLLIRGDVRALPLPDDLHAGRARLLATRGRLALPAADRARFRRIAGGGRALQPDRNPGLLGIGLGLVGVGLLFMHGISPDSEWTTLLVGFLIAGIGIGITNPGIGQAAIAVVPVQKSGMGSGINSTFRQVGISTGVAGLGAIFQSDVNSKLCELLPHAPKGLGEIVASSGSRGVEALHLPPAIQAKTERAADIAFVGGFNSIILIAAILSFAGAAAGFFLTRSKYFVQQTNG